MLGCVLACLGEVNRRYGETALAEARLEEAVQIYRELDETLGERFDDLFEDRSEDELDFHWQYAGALQFLGRLRRDEAELTKAVELYGEAVNHYRRVAREWDFMPVAQCDLAGALYEARRVARAAGDEAAERCFAERLRDHLTDPDHAYLLEGDYPPDPFREAEVNWRKVLGALQ